LKRHIVVKISPNPSLPSGPASGSESLMARREALCAGGQRGEIPPFCKACPPVGREGEEEFRLTNKSGCSTSQ